MMIGGNREHVGVNVGGMSGNYNKLFSQNMSSNGVRR